MQEADLKLKDVRAFNSYFKRFEPADVYLLDGRILYVDTARAGDAPAARRALDCAGRWMIPGLVDIHMHIESSMLTPAPFCRRAAACGVTTLVAEPHEIANVKGVRGVRAMIEAGRSAPIDVYCGIPSSVPSTSESLETTGAVIGFEEMKALLDEKNVACVGEVMNYREIIRENNLEISKFLRYLRENRPQTVVEGHCPALTGFDLAKFLYLGIDADHTEHTLEELRQRFANGMFVEIQAKMLKPEILAYIEENNLYEHFCFVTDDCMADEFATEGHLDVIVRRAIALGMRPEDAVYAATFTPTRRMRLNDRGALAPGKRADFCLLDDLSSLSVATVYKDGAPVWEKDRPLANEQTRYPFPADFYHSVEVKAPAAADFTIRIPAPADAVLVNVIELRDGSTRTQQRNVRMPVNGGVLQWKGSGCLLAAVFERHGKNGNVAYGFVCGYCLQRGAVATTYFHDHHNLFALGGDEASLQAAVTRVIELQGGIVTAENGAVRSELPLPVAGILSEADAATVGAALRSIRADLVAFGYRHYNPIMSLCTLGLPVSPAIKLTDKGLVDVKSGAILPLYTPCNP